MTIKEAVDDLFLLWGVEDVTFAADYVRERAISDINSALQFIHANAKDRAYLARRTITVSISANTSNVELAQDIQTVVGTIRRASDNFPMRQLPAKSHFLNYYAIYEPDTLLPDTSAPHTCFIEKTQQDEADSTKIVLFVIPTPTADTTISLDVAIEPRLYSWDDYCALPPTDLYIPHKYAHSIFLPIARYYAASSHYMIQAERIPLLKADYEKAISLLMGVDPTPNTPQPTQV